VTPGHLLFIPIVLIVGGFLGFIFGARAARNAYDLQRRRDEERAAVRAAREQKKAEKKKDAGATDA
jgi:hypothetical protein